tara:strand:- start:4634 stop:5125 length:492 start_codon:yes stop_codon:yes gene_type:complete
MIMATLDGLTGKHIGWLSQKFRPVVEGDEIPSLKKNDILLNRSTGEGPNWRNLASRDGWPTLYIKTNFKHIPKDNVDNYYSYDLYDATVDEEGRLYWVTRADFKQSKYNRERPTYNRNPKLHIRHSGYDLRKSVLEGKFNLYSTGRGRKVINWTEDPFEEGKG